MLGTHTVLQTALMTSTSLGPSHPREAKVGQKALRAQALATWKKEVKKEQVAKVRKNLTPQSW